MALTQFNSRQKSPMWHATRFEVGCVGEELECEFVVGSFWIHQGVGSVKHIEHFISTQRMFLRMHIDI